MKREITKPISIRVPLDIYVALQTQADKETRSMSNYVKNLIVNDLRKKGVLANGKDNSVL